MLATNINMPLPMELKFEAHVGKRNMFGIALLCILIITILGLGWWQGGNLARSVLPVSTLSTHELGATPSSAPLKTIKVPTPTLKSDPLYTPTNNPTPTPTVSPYSSETVEFQETPTIVAINTSTPLPTNTGTDCIPPAGWGVYIVQPDDNLFHIGLEFGVTAVDLQLANCLGNSAIIYAGQKLYVPNVATRTPPSVPTRTSTEKVVVPTTIEPPSKTPIPTPTDTPKPSDTPLPSPTIKPFPTPIPIPTLTSTPRNTLTPAPLE
jgi:LysM repeat protein